MNIYDIAKKANVSVATVSRVINKSGQVRESTRKKVEKAIAEMHYTPSSVARSLSTQQTDNIGIIVPDIFNPFYARVLAGITGVTRKYGYNTFLFNAEENVSYLHQILHAIMSERLKGIILNPIINEDEETRHLILDLERMGVAIVLLDRDVYGLNCNGVYSDDFGGAYAAVNHMIKLGHRRIALFHGPLVSRPGHERYQGYMQALRDNKIRPEEDLIREYDFMLNGSVYENTKKIMKRKHPPTAFFTSNNYGTLECMKSLLDMDYEIGKDIGLIGFDDIDILHYANRGISAVDRQVEEMGAEAMRLLQTCIMERAEDAKKQKIILDTNLILRGSEYCDHLSGCDGYDQET